MLWWNFESKTDFVVTFSFCSNYLYSFFLYVSIISEGFVTENQMWLNLIVKYKNAFVEKWKLFNNFLLFYFGSKKEKYLLLIDTNIEIVTIQIF